MAKKNNTIQKFATLLLTNVVAIIVAAISFTLISKSKIIYSSFWLSLMVGLCFILIYSYFYFIIDMKN